MKIRLALILLLHISMLAGCAPAAHITIGVGAESPKGPVVLGKFKGEDAEKWVAFVDDGQGDKSVIATQSYVDGKLVTPFTGGSVPNPIDLSTGKTGSKLSISMHNSGSGHGDASKLLDPSSEYLTLGFKEYATGSYRLIGFGYKGALTSSAPAYLGYQETDSDSNTKGDLIFATRPATDTSSPIIRVRITSNGQIKAESPSYAPIDAKDFATKDYVDSKAIPVKTGNTASRPNATIAGVGAEYFDTTLNIPLWSNGIVWRDATGTAK